MPSVAEEARIVRTGSKEGRGAGGVVRLELGTADEIAVGTAGVAASTVGVPESLKSLTKFELASANKPLVLVEAFVNECGPFQFAVDTGASTTVLSSELAERLAIEGEIVPDVTGGGGRISATAGRVESLRFADKTVTHIDVVVTGVLQSLGDAIGKRLDGIIGYNALKTYRVSIDYRNETLALQS